jgi:cellulose synthase/poly-beta-1,6-N-acetylglucosamine synthase-like glycosyltransferase
MNGTLQLFNKKMGRVIQTNIPGFGATAPDAQTTEGREQAERYSTRDIFPSSKAAQFKAPLTPRFAAEVAEWVEQNGYHLAPGSYPLNESLQFRVAATPFPIVPTTPLPRIPTSPPMGARQFRVPTTPTINALSMESQQAESEIDRRSSISLHLRTSSRKTEVPINEQPTDVHVPIHPTLSSTPFLTYSDSEQIIHPLPLAHPPVVPPSAGHHTYRVAQPRTISSRTRIRKQSPMSNPERAVFYLLTFIGMLLTSLFGFWWFEPRHIANNFPGIPQVVDVVLFILLSYVVWYQMLNMVFGWYVAYSMKHPLPMEPEKGAKVAFLTAFVPGKEPYDVLENTLQAMVAADYPHETWLLDEGDDSEAKRLCRKYGVYHFSRKGVARYNQPDGPYKAKTKAGNYNAWYDQHAHRYEFVAQIDVDFIPKKDFLTKTLGYFRDPEVAFVGTPQIYGNLEESWIVKGAAEQAYAFFGPLQKGFFGNDMLLFIGSNHIVRVQAHNSIDGYSGHIVEDHLTGMKFYAHKWKSVYVPEILAIGEGPATWDAYFSQQMRWAYGLFDILFHQSPRLFRKMRLHHVVNYFVLQQYYFFGLTQAIGVFLITLYFLFGIQSTSMNLWELLLLYPPVLIWQQVLFLWLQRFNVDPQKESGFMLRGIFLNCAAWPIYFLALIKVITGKQLTYKVTPKGKEQKKDSQLSLFIPHFVLGTITMLDIAVSLFTHNQAPQILFWAVLNTLTMYYFVVSALLGRIKVSYWFLETKKSSISKVDTVLIPLVMVGSMAHTSKF